MGQPARRIDEEVAVFERVRCEAPARPTNFEW